MAYDREPAAVDYTDRAVVTGRAGQLEVSRIVALREHTFDVLGPVRRRSNAAYVVPGAAGSGALGLLSAVEPKLAAGTAGVVLLTIMPWHVLFAVLVAAAVANRFRLSIGVIALQPADVVLVPVMIHVFLLMRREIRPRWEVTEYIIIFFVLMQFVSSWLSAVNRTRSFYAAALLGFGALAYLTTYTALWTPRRRLFAAKTVLYAALLSSVITDLAFLALHLVGSHFGVQRSAPGQFGQAVAGISYEHDINGSISGSGAAAFLVLSREPNPLFSRRFSLVSFWISFMSMIVSLTRGAWVGFGLVAIALVVIRRRHRVRRGQELQFALPMVGIVVALAGLLFVVAKTSQPYAPNPVAAKASQLFNFGSGTGQARASEWRTALDELKADPIFGLGTNSYGDRHVAPRTSKGNEKNAYIGNLYIRTLYDSGVVGLVLLLLFLYLVLRPALAIRNIPGSNAAIARAFLFGYAVMAIAFAGTDASFQPWPWIFLGVARALSVAVLRERSLRPPGHAPSPSTNGQLTNGRAGYATAS